MRVLTSGGWTGNKVGCVPPLEVVVQNNSFYTVTMANSVLPR